MPIKINPLPSLELLHHHLTYDPETGIFTANTGERAGWKVGSPVGTMDRGYVRIMISKKYYPAHRLAWFMTYGQLDDTQQIDHVDGIRSNNKIYNLRIATHGQNCQNIGLPKHNRSGVKGVHWASYSKKWRAQIKINGKRIFIGEFDTIGEAAEAYRQRAEELHGPFQRK